MKNLSNYEEFLDFITPVIDKKFEHQKEYLACTKGCALCCKTVSMPFSELEFEYLKEGYNRLLPEQQNLVLDRIKGMLDGTEELACPFLINDVCSVYKYRGIICRTFGLLIYNDDKEYTVPFCVHKGLNYAKVFDESTQKISPDKVKKSGFQNEPVFYSLTRQMFFNLNISKDLELNPGESRPLIDWLKDLYLGNQRSKI